MDVTLLGIIKKATLVCMHTHRYKHVHTFFCKKAGVNEKDGSFPLDDN